MFRSLPGPSLGRAAFASSQEERRWLADKDRGGLCWWINPSDKLNVLWSQDLAWCPRPWCPNRDSADGLAHPRQMTLGWCVPQGGGW